MVLLARVASAVLGAVIAVAVFHLPVFAVSHVEVQGLSRLHPGPILQRVALQGRNILTISVDEVEALIEGDPWVRSARLQRRLPGTVVLVVEERAPVALWQTGNRLFALDLDGTVLEEAGATPPAAMAAFPVLKDLDGSRPRPGDRRDGDAVALALRLREALPREMGEAARGFEYLSHGGLVVETDKGRRARFGDSTNFEWKLAVWKAVLKEAEARKIKAGHIDLRFGDRPFFRDS